MIWIPVGVTVLGFALTYLGLVIRSYLNHGLWRKPLDWVSDTARRVPGLVNRLYLKARRRKTHQLDAQVIAVATVTAEGEVTSHAPFVFSGSAENQIGQLNEKVDWVLDQVRAEMQSSATRFEDTGTAIAAVDTRLSERVGKVESDIEHGFRRQALEGQFLVFVGTTVSLLGFILSVLIH